MEQELDPPEKRLIAGDGMKAKNWTPYGWQTYMFISTFFNVAVTTALNILLIKTLDPITGKVTHSQGHTLDIVSAFALGISVIFAGHLCDKLPLQKVMGIGYMVTGVSALALGAF